MKQTKTFGRWAVLAGVVLAGAVAAVPVVREARAQQAPGAASLGGQQVATVDQLKSQAFAALRAGDFDRTNELLSQAAQTSNDPSVVQMAKWTSAFEAQRQEFASERHKQFDKAVADAQTLLKADKPIYALDQTAKAYLLADDKKAFRNDGWVDALVKKSAAMADDFDKNENWVKALRIYSNLSAVEPSNPEWKDKLKLATRRIRLLAMYTPDKLKTIQETEAKERDAADALIADKDSKKPTTKPVTADSNDSFRVDWHETLKGIQADMLDDAIDDAVINYWRQVDYKDLVLGGLNGVKTVLTTPGLEAAFPGIGDEGKRKEMLSAIDESADAMRAAGGSEKAIAHRILTKLEDTNKATVGLPEEVLVSEFADGAFAELDPFSSMIWPSDLEEFTKQTQGEFSGVGIQIQSDDDGSLKVVSPLEDTPAYKAGIKAGDVITQINGKSAKGITLNQAVRTITGPSGTSVTLTVRSPDGTVKDYTIQRETIKVASLKGYQHLPGGGWNYFVDPDQKIAYLRLTNFTKTSGEELDHTADELKQQGVRGIILDLRYNPGGLLTAAADVSDKFLHDGVIVSTRPDRETPNAAQVISAKPDSDEVQVPLVVLVNQYSASASEIVSGALKDHHRALIVGERTFGKGSVQMLFPLEGHKSYLKLTTSHYYLPSGRCIHREENSQEWGVDPDVKVEMTPEQMRAAIDARQEMDVLRDAATATPAEGKMEKESDKAKAVEKAVHDVGPDGKPVAKKKDLLGADPQLSAAVLLLRLELNGAQI